MLKRLGSKEMMLLGGAFLAGAIALTANEIQLAGGFALAGILAALALAIKRTKDKMQLVALVAFAAAGAAAPAMFFAHYREVPFLVASLTYAAFAVAIVPMTRQLWRSDWHKSTAWLVWGQAVVAGIAGACAAYLWFMAPFGEVFVVRRLLFTLLFVGAGLAMLVAGRKSAYPYLSASGTATLAFGLCKVCIYDVTHLHGFLRVAVFASSGLLVMAGGALLGNKEEVRDAA